MRTFLRSLAVVAVLFAAWLGVVASGWLPRPRADDLEAISALQAARTQVAGERNAFAMLYSFAHDVPAAQWEALAAADAAAYRANVDEPDRPLGLDTTYPAYPELPDPHPGLCAAWLPDCLPRVRAHLEETRALVAAGAGQLARGDRLAEYDHYRYGMYLRFDSPLGIGLRHYFRYLFTAIAIDHVDGNSEAAFARLCTTTAAWRRLRANADMLIIDMVGLAQMAGASRLYAEMLAELPADFDAPCDDVFAPLADAEFNQCAVFAQEFEGMQNSRRDAPGAALFAADGGRPGWLRAGLVRLLYNEPHALRLAARSLGRYCGAQHAARIAARSAAPLPDAPGCSALDRLFDPYGCWLADRETIAWDDYYLRVLDLDARLRLLGLARRLRASADPAAAFEARPAALDSPTHAFEHDAATGVVRMRPLNRQRGAHWAFRYRSGERDATAAVAQLPATP